MSGSVRGSGRNSPGLLGKSAHDAVGQARQRCWNYHWVVDLDIRGFFDNIDHELMNRAVRKHAKEKWMVLYIERWLTAPMQEEDGQLVTRDKGHTSGWRGQSSAGESLSALCF